MALSRKTTSILLLAAAALGAGGVAVNAQTGASQTAAEQRAQAAIAAAVAAPTRTEANRARDQYRNPAATLSFFRVQPGETIVELWPGGGWYTEILAPFANATGSTLVAAGPWERGLNGVRRLQEANPDVYRRVLLTEFPAVANSGNPVVTPGTADVVLTFRNVHNWRFGGVDNTREAFRQIFAMLRPGGRLGVVEHRLPETADSALEERSGYMKTSSVIAFAEAAGFRLVGQSEINANPRDTRDHAEGVWALPPNFRGATTDEERARRRAIGESDRMTLLFVRPE
jgi:predicted methyltransferase